MHRHRKRHHGLVAGRIRRRACRFGVPKRKRRAARGRAADVDSAIQVIGGGRDGIGDDGTGRAGGFGLLILRREAEDRSLGIRREDEVGHGRIVIREPLRDRGVSAQYLREISVDARMHEVRELSDEVRRDNHVVERLRVAAEHVGVTVFRGNQAGQIDQVRFDEIERRRHHLVGRGGSPRMVPMESP